MLDDDGGGNDGNHAFQAQRGVSRALLASGASAMVTGGQWLRGLMRAGKAQQRTAKKLATTLFGAPTPKPRARPKAKLKPATLAGALASPVAAKLPKSVARPKPVRVAPPLPGKWMAAHYLSAPEIGAPAGRRMRYWLYVPDKAPSQAALLKGRPLVVMLHGCEQNATQFAQGTRMNRLAEQKGFVVLYPEQSLGSHPQRCWKWYDKATQAGGGDVRLIVGIIEQVATRYSIDRSRIYIGGISAGAGMANIVALNHPDLIAAVGLHSGPVFGASHNTIGALGVMQRGGGDRGDGAIAAVLAGRPGFPQMPTILIQGDSDKVVRPINQAQLARQSMLLNRMPAGTTVSVALKPAGKAGGRNPANAHQIRDFSVGKKLLLRVAEIERLEHAWSGGDASVSFHDKAGPDASKMLIEFFSKHRRAR